MLRFDVAEDGTHFVFDPDLTDGDGMPGYGTSFVTHGYLYPAGTLSESNGVNADGSPEFPDQVLGEWICRGWFVGEGMRTTTGAIVVTSQLYSFGDTPGEAMISSDGYELADVGVEIARAITGGTGSFVGAGGERGRSCSVSMPLKASISSTSSSWSVPPPDPGRTDPTSAWPRAPAARHRSTPTIIGVPVMISEL